MYFGCSRIIATGRWIGEVPSVQSRQSIATVLLFSLVAAIPVTAGAQEPYLDATPPPAQATPPPTIAPTRQPVAPTRPNARPAVRRVAPRTSTARQTPRPTLAATTPASAPWEEARARAQSQIAIEQQAAETARLNAKVERLNKRLELRGDVRRKLEDAAADRARTNWALGAIFCAIVIFMLVSAWLFYRLSRMIVGQAVGADRPLGLNEDPTTRDIPLTRLPLGLPDGSVRAIISLFIVIVGFLVLAFEKTLQVQSSAAISGFIGAIISFYFATRNEAATRDTAAAANQAASQANTALQQASKDAIQAAAHTNQMQSDVLNKQLDRALAGASTTAASPQAALSLQTLGTDLEHVRQLTQAVAAIPVGTGPVSGASDVVQRIDTMLATIKPLLSGTADPAAIATVAAQADALLREVTNDNPVVSTIAGALATVAQAARNNGVVGQVLTGLGGPVGLVGGLLFSGIKLFADQRQFEAWKKAVLAQPFDVDALSISPDDPTLPEAAAVLSPLVSLIAQSPDMIRELYRISVVAPGQTPQTADELAAGSAEANTPLFQAFGSDTRVLTDALIEYRTTLVSLVAANALPPRLPGDPASATPTIASSDLVRAVGAVRQEPGAAGALDQMISVIEALARNTLGTDVAPLLSGAITVAKDVLWSEPTEDQP